VQRLETVRPQGSVPGLEISAATIELVEVEEELDLDVPFLPASSWRRTASDFDSREPGAGRDTIDLR
jgi:hypothetical protein